MEPEKSITLTLPVQLAQEIINLLGEMPAKASARTLLDFVQRAQDAIAKSEKQQQEQGNG